MKSFKRAFTLIELLVVIAIIAILAAILFPVFAKAKTAAKITATLSGLKQIALGLQMYSADFDDMAVPHYGTGTPTDPNQYHNTNTWVGRTQPYVKNRGIFFDKVIGDPREDSTLPDGTPVFVDPFFGAGYEYRWEWITNLSLNMDGYSWKYSGTDCNNWGTTASIRSLTSVDDVAARMAVTTTRYANLPYSWMYFMGVYASWPDSTNYAGGWDWYQLVFDSRQQYEGPRFVAAYADGHAGKYGIEKFAPWPSVAPNYAAWCAKMNNEEQMRDFWGTRWGD